MVGAVDRGDYGGPLVAWMGTVVRLRRHPEGRPGLYAQFEENVWWVRQEHQPSSMAAGLRVLSREKEMPGSGTNWRAVVPAEQRFLITNLLGEAEEQLQQLRGAQVGASERRPAGTGRASHFSQNSRIRSSMR